MGGNRAESATIDISGCFMLINGYESRGENLSDAILLGDGVFETMRSYQNRVFALEEHLARLRKGCESLGVRDFDIEKVRSCVLQILQTEPLESGALRISIYADGNWLISHKTYSESPALLRCELRSISVNASQGFKSASYGARLQLRRSAMAKGFDDVVLMDESGEISELTTSNLVIFEEGRWKTPRLASGCLPGITRRLLIENFGVEEGLITADSLRQGEAAAAISSLREIQGIKEIDGKDFTISNQMPQQVRQLKESFHRWILGNLSR